MAGLVRVMTVLTAVLRLYAGAQAAAADEPVGSQPTTAARESQPASEDAALSAARALVEGSDRYLHHSRLSPGMKGFGLTVLSGTQPSRFDVEILSVMKRWGPDQDVILVRLGGDALRETGVISGMSGSPIYVRDPADGKDKLIGAVAYAFLLAKEPICGVQPITQMLAVDSLQPSGQPVEVSSGGVGLLGGRPAFELMRAAMDPRRRDLMTVLWEHCRRQFSSAGSPQLVPLATPLMVSGLSERTLAEVSEPLKLAGLLPVQSGRAASLPAEADLNLVPGSALSVLLITGDIDISAIGTVTDVVGEKVLAFGHSLLAEGDVELPMGPAYVHTVVPNLLISFKLGSAGSPTGALVRDERVGVSGFIGRKAAMVPMNVSIDWTAEGRSQSFHYELANHRIFTPLLAGLAMIDSTYGWRNLPPQHTVRYRLDIDFGRLGRYRAENVSSGTAAAKPLEDLLRPLLAMLNNPLGPPATIESIDLHVTVEPADTTADILELRLDGDVYMPGEQITGQLTVKPFRQAKRTISVSFRLPSDLPDGSYRLTACDWSYDIEEMMYEMPQRFDPRNPTELLRSIQLLAEPRGNRVYLRLPLGREGLAIRSSELPDLPASRRDILAQAGGESDTKDFSQSLVRSDATDFVLSGSASAQFQVQRKPKEIILRHHKESK